MSERFVRPANRVDAARIAEIYNQGIADRVATFETEPRTASQIERWFDSDYVVFVAGSDGRIAAYATAFPYRSRPCYEGVREFSVYVARETRGHGFGRSAMLALMAECRRRGWWKLLSRIFLENVASLGLVKSLGFREVGVYEKHARLDGEWRDVVIVEKFLPEE